MCIFESEMIQVTIDLEQNVSVTPWEAEGGGKKCRYRMRFWAPITTSTIGEALPLKFVHSPALDSNF